MNKITREQMWRVFVITAVAVHILACGEKKATMVLTWSPADADVSVDGYRPNTMTSPYTFEFYKPGTYRLNVSAIGYEPVSMMVTVESGKVLTQTVNLVKKAELNATPNIIATQPADSDPVESDTATTHAPTPGEYILSVTSTPDGATVMAETNTIKSVIVMHTPAHHILRKNVPWHLTISKEGYEPVKRTVIGPADQDTVNLNVTLTPQQTMTPANISGTGPTPETANPKVNVTPPLEIKPVTGSLSVDTHPWTVVTVDGKVIGNTPVINYSISVGKHTVLLENRDLAKRKVQIVTVGEGEHIRLLQEL